MKTKRIITRQSIEELLKVCPGVTVPSRAMSTIYACGDGSYNNPFTWDEFQAYRASCHVTSGTAGGVYYYDPTGNLIGDINNVEVTASSQTEAERLSEEKRKREEEERLLEEARLKIDFLLLLSNKTFRG